MTGLARAWAVALLGLSGCASRNAKIYRQPAKDPQAREVIDAALEDLRTSPEPSRAGRKIDSPSKREFYWELWSSGEYSIDLLAQTPAHVDPALVDLAGRCQERHGRCRAVLILALRGSPAVIPILEEMCRNGDSSERFLGWALYGEGMRAERLRPPKDPGDVLRLYVQEEDREVREEIQKFFGWGRIGAAVEPLIQALGADRNALYAIWALGRIGDPRAVKPIIDAFPGLNPHYNLQALGGIATPEAIDFIIDHLNEYGAVEALCQTGSKKALPALRAHMEQLLAENPEHLNRDLNLALARVAIIKLADKDPALLLMTLAESPGETMGLREHALSELLSLDTSAFSNRILRLYVNDPDWGIKSSCLRLLDRHEGDEITLNLIEQALTFRDDGKHGKSGMSIERALVKALNQRLNTTLRSLSEMSAYLRRCRGER